MQIHTLDLKFFRGETIAAYLIESNGHPVLVETGPDSTWPHLVAALARHGVAPSDVKGRPRDAHPPRPRGGRVAPRAGRSKRLGSSPRRAAPGRPFEAPRLRDADLQGRFVRMRLDAGKGETAIAPEFEAWLTDRLLAKGVSAAGFEADKTALPFAMNVTGLVRFWRTAGKAA